MSDENEPVAWMRRWAFNKEAPKKEKNSNNRWAYPLKYKLKEVTLNKFLSDDVPLYAKETL